jgi:fused signal recognition particle receptor
MERLRAGLKKAREKLTLGLKSLLSVGRKLDDDLIDELEEKLLTADLGPTTALAIMDSVKKAYKARSFNDAAGLYEHLKGELAARLQAEDVPLACAASGPTVILVVGVNGSGKTTTIAKLAHLLKGEGKSVLLAAGDTFRAAAIEQLETWSRRIGVDLIKHEMGADPAAVAFDAAAAAQARGVDYLIVDTAGRLHTKENLMKELEKVRRVMEKKIPDAPHEVLLVLDATTGQNAVNQARIFNESVKVTGIVLSKLDGTAKGGIVFAIRDEVGSPVKLIGLGEKQEDLERFSATSFVEALFE